MGKQSPYCVCRVGEVVKRTQTDKRSGQEPSWNAVLEFNIPSESYHIMKITVFHEGFRKHPHLIGDTVLSFEKAMKEELQSEWYELKNEFQFAGELSVQFKFIPTDPLYFDRASSKPVLQFPYSSVAALTPVPKKPSKPSKPRKKVPVSHPLPPTPPSREEHVSVPRESSLFTYEDDPLPSFPSPYMVDDYYTQDVFVSDNVNDYSYGVQNPTNPRLSVEDYDANHSSLPPVPPPHLILPTASSSQIFH